MAGARTSQSNSVRVPRILAFHEALKVARAPSLAQVAQRLSLDLANTFARDGEQSRKVESMCVKLCTAVAAEKSDPDVVSRISLGPPHMPGRILRRHKGLARGTRLRRRSS
jgi:hypothetical protein